jgi:CPA2 family monovalent cation:H+ antiporter-2
MDGLAILLLAAAVGHMLALRLRVPAAPALMLCGVLVARTGMVPTALLEGGLILGATFLLFATGIELDPARVRTQRPVAIRVGVLQFSVLGAAGFATALLMGYGRVSALYLGLALTASSTLVVVGLLQRRARFFEPSARLVIGVLLLQDVLVVLLVPPLMRLAEGVTAVLASLVGSIALLLLAGFVLRRVSPQLLRLAKDEETLLLSALALLFAFIGMAGWLRLPVVVGAFLAGVSLARFPVNGIVRPHLDSIADFFTAIFYTALGAVLEPGPGDLLRAALLAGLVLIVTPPLVAFIAERYGFSSRAALESGLLLSQTSEMSLIVGLSGMLAGQITQSVFTIIALVTVITMMLTPFLATDRLVWWVLRRYPERRSPVLPVSGHVLLLGSGTTGMPVLETILAAGHDVVVVDDDPAVIGRLRQADIPCIRGDATDPQVLRDARADRARIISSTIRRPEDNRRLLEFARGVPVLVRVFDEGDAAWVRALGGIPIVYSEAAADGLLRWFDRTFGRAASRERGGAVAQLPD